MKFTVVHYSTRFSWDFYGFFDDAVSSSSLASNDRMMKRRGIWKHPCAFRCTAAALSRRKLKRKKRTGASLRLVFVSAIIGKRVLQTHMGIVIAWATVLGLTVVFFFFRCSKEITLTGLLCYYVLYFYFFLHLSHVCNAGNVRKYTLQWPVSSLSYRLH